MKRTIILIGCIGMLAASAQAVQVHNITSSSELFFDNFENPAITPSTTSAYTETPDADPIASAGSWNPLESNGDGMLQVTSGVASDPVPYQGNRDLRIYREAAHDQHDLRALLSSVQSTPGDVIHVSMMVYFPSATNVIARGQFILSGPSLNVNGGFHTSRAWVYNHTDGFVHTIGPGEADTTTAVPYLTNTWQEWTMDYAVGASTFNFSVAGIGGSGNSFSTGDVYGIQIINGSNVPGSFFLDTVPEPASLMALAMSVPGLLLRRRRRV